MSRALVGLVITIVLVAGCSTSSHSSQASPTTTSTSSPLSARQLDRRLCVAYAALWDTDYSGGEPGAAMIAKERALVDTAEATPDQALHDAVRGVIDGELGLPRFYLRATAKRFEHEASGLPPDVQAALQEVRANDRIVEANCTAAGRPVTGVR